MNLVAQRLLKFSENSMITDTNELKGKNKTKAVDTKTSQYSEKVENV
jgi:hypothetical protein